MCGRFIQAAALTRYTEPLGIEAGPTEQPPARYNVAPTSQVAALRVEADGAVAWASLRWGLVPAWSDGPDRRYSMINARAETVAGRAAFREPFRRRRCIILADGFYYEWATECHGRQPYLIRSRDRTPLFFAGLWEHWQRERPAIDSCVIIVTDANGVVAPVHDRMPVCLPPEAARRWLAPDTPPDELQAMLVPAPDETVQAVPVSSRVNNPRNEGPDLAEPLPEPPCGG
jgi:putative SOS response-associated peptidase YedK